MRIVWGITNRNWEIWKLGDWEINIAPIVCTDDYLACVRKKMRVHSPNNYSFYRNGEHFIRTRSSY